MQMPYHVMEKFRILDFILLLLTTPWSCNNDYIYDHQSCQYSSNQGLSILIWIIMHSNEFLLKIFARTPLFWRTESKSLFMIQPSTFIIYNKQQQSLEKWSPSWQNFSYKWHDNLFAIQSNKQFYRKNYSS